MNEQYRNNKYCKEIIIDRKITFKIEYSTYQIHEYSTY